MIGQVVKGGALYFALVFAAGFALGIVRELWAVPRFGARLAELLETPLMLLAVVGSARWTVRRHAAGVGWPGRLGLGAVALALLLAAELGVMLWLRDLSLADYVASRDPVSGTVYLVMLGVFALMPGVLPPR